jgi:hypothetical protein
MTHWDSRPAAEPERVWPAEQACASWGRCDNAPAPGDEYCSRCRNDINREARHLLASDATRPILVAVVQDVRGRT